MMVALYSAKPVKIDMITSYKVWKRRKKILWLVRKKPSRPNTAQGKGGFYYVTTLWALYPPKDTTQVPQAKNVSWVSSSITLEFLWILSVKDEGPWLNKMTNKQKCFPASLAKCGTKYETWGQVCCQNSFVVNHYGISLESNLNYFIGLGLYKNFILSSLLATELDLNQQNWKKNSSVFVQDFLFL